MREEPQQGFVLGIIVLLSVFFLLTPFVTRSLQGNDSLLGQESYFHLGVAQNVLEPGEYPIEEAGATLFDVFVASLILFMKPLFVGKLIPVLLGVLTVLVFFFQVRKLVDEDERAVASLFLLISPLYLIMFSSLAPAGLLLLITLIAWWLYDRYPIASMCLLGLLIFIDARGFIIASLLMIAYGLLRGTWKPAAISGGIGLTIIIFLEGVFGFLAKELVLMPASLSDFFVSLGADFGYSFFILFLALVGLLVSWSRKRHHIAASIILLAVFMFSFGNTTARVLLLPITAVLAGKGLLVLVRRTWTVKSIRNATLFLIGLSLLFTLVLTISGQVGQSPSMEKLEALQFLRAVPDDEIVLSSAANGIFIERIAHQSAFLDDVVGDEQMKWQREVAAQRIFMAQRMNLAGELLLTHKISHILVDQEMRDGGVWTHEEQGLLFLLEHNPRFIKLYDKGDIQVYRFVEE